MFIDTEYFLREAAQLGIELSANQAESFDSYASFLVEYNEKVNLTAIKGPKDIVVKHFLDSLLFLKAVEIPKGASLVDVGTGAGFPGVPLKIAREDIRLTLMDSLNKRVTFLQLLSEKLVQDNCCVHYRAEEAGRSEHRECYDFATARAVADLKVLAEYCLPMVKVGGYFVALKGYDCDEEIAQAQNAINLLGGKVEKIERFILPEDNKRAVILIKKISQTSPKYPRNSGQMAKKSL